MFVTSEFISGGFWSRLDDSDGASRVSRAWRSEERLLLEQWFYASQKVGAQKKLLNSIVLIRGKSDGKEEAWAGRVIMLFWCLMRERIEGEGLAAVRYMEYVPTLDEVDEALRGVSSESDCGFCEEKAGRGGRDKRPRCCGGKRVA